MKHLFMKKITKFAMAFMLFGMISCSDDDSSSTSNCTSTIPFLQPGKTFTYNLSQFGFDSGTINLAYGECNGNGFLVTRQSFDPSGVAGAIATDLYKQEGDFLLTDSNNNNDYFAKIYKKNATLGESWNVTRPDGSIVTHEVVDIDSLVTVPAGSFHCKVFKYTTTTAVNESFVFWNDEVGNIMEDAGFFKLELKTHN